MLIQLRSGDQFLTRAGRFLISYFDQTLDERALPELHKSLVYDSQNDSQVSRILVDSELQGATRAIPEYPQSLLAVLGGHNEPTRARYWLLGCFEESQNTHVAQERVFQGYKISFASIENPRRTFSRGLKDTFRSVQLERLDKYEEIFIVNGLRPRSAALNVLGLDQNIAAAKSFAEPKLTVMALPPASSRSVASE